MICLFGGSIKLRVKYSWSQCRCSLLENRDIKKKIHCSQGKSNGQINILYLKGHCSYRRSFYATSAETSSTLSSVVCSTGGCNRQLWAGKLLVVQSLWRLWFYVLPGTKTRLMLFFSKMIRLQYPHLSAMKPGAVCVSSLRKYFHVFCVIQVCWQEMHCVFMQTYSSICRIQ